MQEAGHPSFLLAEPSKVTSMSSCIVFSQQIVVKQYHFNKFRAI